jgi:hypothetical protein
VQWTVTLSFEDTRTKSRFSLNQIHDGVAQFQRIIKDRVQRFITTLDPTKAKKRSGGGELMERDKVLRPQRGSG